MSKSISAESKVSYYGWVVVGIALIANLITFGLVYSYSVFFKPLASEFGWSRSVTAGAFSTYAIVHTILAFFCGWIADRHGPRLIVAVGGFFLGLSMLLMSYIDSVWQLYLVYGGFFSIGVAALYTPLIATVSRWFRDKRGIAIGITAAGLGAGAMIFSPLSAWLVSVYGWRFAYVTLGIVTWISFIPVIKFLKNSPNYIFETSGELVEPEGFTFFEAFRTRTFWAFCLTWLFAAFALWSIMIHIVSLLTDRGMSIVEAGFLAGLIGAGSLIGRVVSGYFSDKFSRKRVLIVALFIQLAATVWFLFSNEIWALYAFAIFFGLGSGGCAALMGAFPADYFGFKSTGAILGFGVVIAGIGLAIGPYFGGYIFDVKQSYDYMIIACIVANLMAIISSLCIRTLKNTNDG